MEKDIDHPLIKLGAKFQKNKVMTEKLLDLAQTGNEDAYKLSLEMDIQTEKLQTMIYFWIDDVCNRFMEFLKSKIPFKQEIHMTDFQPPLPPFLLNNDYKKLIAENYIDPLEIRFKELIKV